MSLTSHVESGVLRSQAVKNVMSSVDRDEFCPTDPYWDSPAPIGFNATISAPHMHAYALEMALPNLKPGAKVLDVGSGSGYLTVCFAKFVEPAGRVIGIEHVEGLVDLSIRNTEKSHKHLMESGLIKYVVGDGRLGYPAEAPYDVIHVGAAAGQVPPALLGQLANGGIMIIPVGELDQSVRLIKKDQSGHVTQTDVLPVRYVPLTDRDQQLHI